MHKEKERLEEKLASYNKEAEIDKYKNELNYAYEHSLLQLSDEELQEKRDFIAKHVKSCGNDCFVYSLTGTGIGTVIKITCSTCGETEDITDIASW